jgi:hypothetical protein
VFFFEVSVSSINLYKENGNYGQPDAEIIQIKIPKIIEVKNSMT